MDSLASQKKVLAQSGYAATGFHRQPCAPPLDLATSGIEKTPAESPLASRLEDKQLCNRVSPIHSFFDELGYAAYIHTNAVLFQNSAGRAEVRLRECCLHRPQVSLQQM